ncbi:uncharacterized protein LOC125842828 [Solanum stenotomum]|uniref:uncharacterized protein LOC125842828 n=1 Tax=Solanum stenotomum TaxID=172797 RepID=UPI0020D1CD91|nr:uncharacterized protein LOC125842828 [Solanum stenotomum]
MGHLTYSADLPAASLETFILDMIQAALTAAVTPLSTDIDTLVARITVCERGQGATDEVTTLKATIVELRKYVHYLKSTDMSMVFGTMEILNVPEMPPTTTGHKDRMEQTVEPESKADIGEEMMGETEGGADEDLTETEAPMIDRVVQASLAITPFAVSSEDGSSR